MKRTVSRPPGPCRHGTRSASPWNPAASLEIRVRVRSRLDGASQAADSRPWVRIPWRSVQVCGWEERRSVTPSTRGRSDLSPGNPVLHA